MAPTVQYNHHYPAYMPQVLFPTGLAYLAAALKYAGHEVYGCNPNNDDGYSSAREMLKARLETALDKVKPDMVAIGGLCTDHRFLKDSIEIVRRKHSPKIVLGGGIVTHDAEFIMQQLQPEFCISGEGEQPLVALANALDNHTDFTHIPNLGYWQNGKAVFTQQDFDYQDINLLPFPDYEVFGIQDDKYTYTARWIYRYTRLYPRTYTIITARSCPFACTFCIHERRRIRYRARNIDNIIKEIVWAYSKYRFNILTILDELFAANKERLREFCMKLREARQQYDMDFDWSFGTHASANLDFDTLELAKGTGCFFYSYGIESMSPVVLASMNKKIQPEQIRHASAMAQQSRLMFGGNLIFGDPAETEETMHESLDFMMKHLKDSNMCINAIRPYPGSKLFELCLERGLIRDKAEYYEHIDEQPWNMTVNMTAVPDKKWLPLLDSVVTYGQLYPWVKAVKAEAVEKLADLAGKEMYRIQADCPHCGFPNVWHEWLGLEEKAGSNALSKGRDWRLVFDAVLKAYRLIGSFYLWQSKIFRLLRSAESEKHTLLRHFIFGTFFITGCKACHKTVKVVIPVKLSWSMLSIAEIKRRMNLA